MKIVFKSPLNINDCAEKLREVRKRNPSSIFLYHPVLPLPSDIQDNRICLGYRSGGRNSFSPVFLGKFSSTNNNQTELRGELVLHPFVKAFMVFWMSLASFFASLLLVVRIKNSLLEQKAFQIGASDAVLLLPIGGLLLLLFGNALGQSDGKAIINLLQESLKVTSVERLSTMNIFSRSNLISVGVLLIFIFSGTILGFSSNVQQREDSANAELLSFYTCSKPSENECVPTSYFNEKPKEVYACGDIQTSSQSRVNMYWYHESAKSPIYYATDIWLEQGFFCEKLDISEYESGNYIVKVYHGKNVLGQYDFAVK